MAILMAMSSYSVAEAKNNLPKLLDRMLAGEAGPGGLKFDDVHAAYTVGSVALALILSPWPWFLVPVAAALIGGSWIWTRPEA